MEKRKILIIDETLREGMQYRGVMFSLEQRLKILGFQERLKVDICQAGYPPAHASEAHAVSMLCDHARDNGYGIRIAAMGRATPHDAAILVSTRVNDLHFHLHVKEETPLDRLDAVFAPLLDTMDLIGKQRPGAVLSIAMLDIGRTDDRMLGQCLSFLSRHGMDILSLPDTSGMMAPNQIFEKINRLAGRTGQTKISIHCHNDLGMATANSVMGILAGGSLLEASVLGIGERNGIADLYTTAKILQDQGFDIGLSTDDVDTFNAYYDYVDAIVYDQTGSRLLTCSTPVFGDAVKTHVAGTHARGQFGMAKEERFFLNVLCGRHLVKRYLDTHGMGLPENMLDRLTREIKSESARLNRCLTSEDIQSLISSLSDAPPG